MLDIARASLTVGYGGGFNPTDTVLWFPFHMAHFMLPLFLLGPYSSPSFIRPFVSTMPRSLRRYTAERLAMAVTKVWADRFVDIPWLAEVEFLEARGIITFLGTSRERPDLVGQDGAMAWHVLESKGRLNSTSVKGPLGKAKRQAGRVATVNGVAPGLTIGCVLHSKAGLLHLTLDDPPPKDDAPLKAEIRMERFYATYYHDLRNLISKSEFHTREHGKQLYYTVKLSSAPDKLSLGLLKPIHDDIMKGVELLRKEPIHSQSNGLQSIGKDGTALFVD